LKGQLPLGVEILYGLPKKVDLGGSKYTCRTLLLVDQSSQDFFAECCRVAVNRLVFRFCISTSILGTIRINVVVKTNYDVDVQSVDLFKKRLDKFWRCQDVMFDWKADLTRNRGPIGV